jgi:hypothetical protein
LDQKRTITNFAGTTILWNFQTLSEMVMPLRALRCLMLIPLLLIPVARADVVTKHVDLVCHAAANLALIRFSISEDAIPTYPRLPQALDRGLSASTGSARTDCTLANGTTIRVRGGEEQGFAYGMGSANPPAFFSLWINQRKVFSRKIWMPGYAASFDNPPIFDGVLIAANRITTCATAEGKRQHCTSQSLDLASVPIDRAEYDSTKQTPPLGHISVIAKGAANQRFCEAYLGSIKPGIESALVGQQTSLDIDLAPLTQQTSLDEPMARSGLVELLPGVTRRLMIWAGESHYFDGTVIALASSSMTMENINAAYPFKDIEVWPERGPPPDITLISGGQKQLYPGVSPRYVHLVPQRIDGSLHVFAYPTNKKVRPTAALVKPLVGGGFATLCAFNRTEPRY